MKTTYLLREVQQDGSICLVETTSETWHSIVKEEAQLPQSQRRCFICDTIADGRDLDCMVMETTFEEWQAYCMSRNCLPSRKSRWEASLMALVDSRWQQYIVELSLCGQVK